MDNIPKDSCNLDCSEKCFFKHHHNIEKTRYLSCAFVCLLQQLKHRNIDYKATKIYILGGSNILKRPSTVSIGEANIKKIKEMIAQYNLNIYSENLGGDVGRTIFFNTSNGEIIIKLHSNQN